ncbi:MAG: uracil-DNA glycosylase family protein [Microvirga sp.]|nr:uracil-DNA glycosylase family protein [Microvirga sp.]
MASNGAGPDLDDLLAGLRACRVCRVCRDPADGRPLLPHEPRPIIQASSRARICIASQAPGARAHAKGLPFFDQSGVRLRDWLGLDETTFYDPEQVAIVPMGHCFPGYDAQGGDLPPRRECAPLWRERVFAGLPRLSLVLTIGLYAQKWHLGPDAAGGLTATVARWRAIVAQPRRPRIFPLPHPSWRNNGWLRRNPWFEAELLPVLRAEIRAALADADIREEAL